MTSQIIARHQFPDLLNVPCRFNEADANEIHVVLGRELDHMLIAISHQVALTLDKGHVDSLATLQSPVCLGATIDVVSIDFNDRESESPIIG